MSSTDISALVEVEVTEEKGKEGKEKKENIFFGVFGYRKERK